MLDFLTSKGALTFAALMMLAIMFSVVDTTNEVTEQRNYDVIADAIAETLSEVNANPGNVTIALIFDDSGPDSPGVHYPQTIGGENYRVLLFGDTIVIQDENGKMRAMANLNGDVHGWAVDECVAIHDPEGYGLTSEEIMMCDDDLNGGSPWSHDTSNAFVLDVSKRDQRIDGEIQFLTVALQR